MEHTRGLLWFLVGWCLEEEDGQIPRPAAKNFLKAREGGPGPLWTGGWGRRHPTMPCLPASLPANGTWAPASCNEFCPLTLPESLVVHGWWSMGT